jgi:hypothetical protein
MGTTVIKSAQTFEGLFAYMGFNPAGIIDIS